MNTSRLPGKHIVGFSLIELMVAIGISAVLMTVLLSLTSYTARSFSAISNYVALDRASRHTLDQITMKIREADGVTAFTTNRLDLSYHSEPLSYVYNPTAKILTEISNGRSRTMLRDCDTLTFSIFQRNPINGVYDQYPAALNANAAKSVQVSWICSRKMLVGLINSESIQSGKIVIRKQ